MRLRLPARRVGVVPIDPHGAAGQIWVRTNVKSERWRRENDQQKSRQRFTEGTHHYPTFAANCRASSREEHSAVPNLYVMAHRSTPRVLAALAGFVHHSQRAHGDEHNRDQDNDEGAFHGASRPRSPVEFSWFKNEPRVNSLSLRRSKKSSYCPPPIRLLASPLGVDYQKSC